MDELQVTNNNIAPIQLNKEPELKPILTRKQEAELRKEEFFKELNKAHGIQEEAPRIEEPREVHPESEEIKEPNDHDESFEEENELDNKPIPKKRFDKELEKRKLLEEELKRERESRIKYETELSLYNKAISQMSEQKQADHSPELDPIDTDAHNLYMRKIKELENKYEQQNNSMSEYRTRQEFAQTVDKQAAEYSQKHPDFTDAYNYLLNIEAQKVKLLGYGEQEANQYALQQLQPIAWQAYQSGKNVAEIAYNMAKNYGYKVATPSNISKPNLDSIDRNMQKSYSALKEVPGVSTSVAPESAAYNNLDGFTRNLGSLNKRGIDQSKFYEAIEKIRKAGL